MQYALRRCPAGTEVRARVVVENNKKVSSWKVFPQIRQNGDALIPVAAAVIESFVRHDTFCQ